MLKFFPLQTPRANQVEVLKVVEKAFQDGYRYVLLEVPVGGGKSAIAVSAARYFGSSHILTPRKSLQDQYFADFQEHIHLMKGRSAYPCVYSDSSQYTRIVSDIKKGDTPNPSITGTSVAAGPCNTRGREFYEACNARHTCPYAVAISVACAREHVVHNVHSFIFQAYMHSKFDKRGIMVVDECHNLEDICRDFMTRKITVRGIQGEDFKVPDFRFVDDYEEFLMDPKRQPRRIDQREEYIGSVDSLMKSGMKDFVVDWTVDRFLRSTEIRFIPRRVQGTPERLMFSFADKVLLMSGTIYDKREFCQPLGISTEETFFLRMPSTFHPKNRPIYMKREYMVDTSHAAWDTNLPRIIQILKTILSKFPDVKGLVHTPSYHANTRLFEELEDTGRVMTHERENFQEKLNEFYDAKTSLVFLSPICQEGVDFKDDRARFQVILRVPYPNAGDKFTKTVMEEDFQWYNRKALIVFGQQYGRVNRSERDVGATILVDSRFPRFIANNRKKLPKWVLDAVVTD